MGDDQIKEASWVVQSVAGASAYMHGIQYDQVRFGEEVNQIVEFLKRKQQQK